MESDKEKIKSKINWKVLILISLVVLIFFGGQLKDAFLVMIGSLNSSSDYDIGYGIGGLTGSLIGVIVFIWLTYFLVKLFSKKIKK